jgi:pyridoxal/pyridoxine/pyridoxamine kinase
MAHYVEIVVDDEMIDAVVFCSDFCAKSHEAYNGWNGCYELDFDTPCNGCGDLISGIEGVSE